MNSSNKYHPKLEALFPIAKGIAETFGENAEVVIHDVGKPENSLIFMAGNVTGRKLGAPLTNLALEALKKSGDNASDLIGYQTTTKDGKILKSSTLFIRDVQGKIIGCLCINLDITNLLTCQKILEYYTKTNKPVEHKTLEEFYKDVNDAMREIVQGVLNDYPIPVKFMQKEDKLQIVKKLDGKGVFLVKGAIDYVATILHVSRYTIYNYLEETRSTIINNIS